MIPPEISIIIPCFNQGHYLSEALISVINQTFTDWEAIVVDDGSEDETRQVTTQFNDSRIRYIFQENRGLSAARNVGIRAAGSEIIALLDADDIWREDYLQTVKATFDNYPEAIAVYCGFTYIDSDGNQIGVPQHREVPPDEFSSVILQKNWLVPSSVVFQKQMVEKVDYFDEDLQAVEDWDMWVKMSRHGPFVGIPLIMVKYRLHDSNMSKDPYLMVSSHLQIIRNNYGAPDGNPAEWSALKRMSYRCFFNQSAERYLVHGDLNQGAKYFLDMLAISPENGFKMGVWRSLIRLHLPPQIRHALGVIDWDRSEKEISDLFDRMQEIGGEPSIIDQFIEMRASAYLALAREAAEALEPSRAFNYLWHSVKLNPPIIMKRAFWGTSARAVYSPGIKRYISSSD